MVVHHGCPAESHHNSELSEIVYYGFEAFPGLNPTPRSVTLVSWLEAQALAELLSSQQ